MIKILTKNGVENTNIDGARANYISTGRQIGVLKDVLNETNLFTLTDSYIVLNPCELVVLGHRVVITEPEYLTTADTVSFKTPYFLIADLSVTEESVDFRLYLQNSTSGVGTPKWFNTVSGEGRCIFILCRFYRTGAYNHDLTRYVEPILGSVKIAQTTGDSEDAVMSQKATADAIDKGLPEKVRESNIFQATLSIHTWVYSAGEGGAVKLLNQKISTDSPLPQTLEFSGSAYGDYSGIATCRLYVSPSDLVKGGLIKCKVETIFEDSSLGTESSEVWLTPATKEEVETYEYSFGNSKYLYHIEIEKNSAYYNALNLLASKDYYGNTIFSNSVIANPSGVAVAIKDPNPLNPRVAIKMQDSAEANVSLYGNNLVNINAVSTKYGSVNFTEQGELIWVSGSKYYLEFPISLPAGVRISMRMTAVSGDPRDQIGNIRFIRTDDTEISYSATVTDDVNLQLTKTLPAGLPINRVRIYKSQATTGLYADMYISNLQIELGDITDYTPYRIPTGTTIPAEGLDLTVPEGGITVMPQDASSERVIVATYPQDINSTVTNLLQRISALESAVIGGSI